MSLRRRLGILLGTGAVLAAALSLALAGPMGVALATHTPGNYPACGGGTSQNCISASAFNGGAVPSTIDLAVAEAGTDQITITWFYTGTGSLEYDLLTAGSPVTAGTVLSAVINVGSFDPIALMTTGDVVSVAFSLNSNPGNTVSFAAKPKASAWTTSTTCMATTGGCGTDTTMADVAYAGALLAVVTNMTTPIGLPADQLALFTAFRSAARGTWIGTNAQAFGGPEQGSLAFRLAAPHLKPDGSVNTGFFKAFLPIGLLTNLGFASLTDANSSTLVTVKTVSGSSTTVTTTVTQQSDGVLVEQPSFPFSSNSFAISKSAGDDGPDLHSIRGVAFRDDNGNGSRDPSEPALSGVPISMVGSGVQTTSRSDGSYELCCFRQGNYTISGGGATVSATSIGAKHPIIEPVNLPVRQDSNPQVLSAAAPNSAGNLSPAIEGAASPAGGRFASETGFWLHNGEGIPFLDVATSVGLQDAGYPASRRFTSGGFRLQVFQKMVLQAPTQGGPVAFLNTMDELHDRGYDEWLYRFKSTPRQLGIGIDAGLSDFAAVVARRLALLDADRAIADRYWRAGSRALDLYGLPTSRV
ncbi:MAG: hypothetical protein HYY05_07350, partial [Chloroflexi bacterium]|nr:hypothetical protein [Chloroflexota bacterium]